MSRVWNVIKNATRTTWDVIKMPVVLFAVPILIGSSVEDNLSLHGYSEDTCTVVSITSMYCSGIIIWPLAVILCILWGLVYIVTFPFRLLYKWVTHPLSFVRLFKC